MKFSRCSLAKVDSAKQLMPRKMKTYLLDLLNINNKVVAIKNNLEALLVSVVWGEVSQECQTWEATSNIVTNLVETKARTSEYLLTITIIGI